MPETLAQRSAAVLDLASAPAVITPSSAAAAAESVSQACADGLGVVPWGGGTAQRLGMPPTRCAVVISTVALSGIVFYTPQDLTIGVRAGTTMGEVQATLARSGQFLPLDVPCPEHATVGGVVATALGSVRRLRFGGVRDCVIGLEAALSDGSRCRSGGRVVKNVAGYDLCKLFSGSLGTLGLLLEVNFKVQPMARAQAVVRCLFSSLSAALESVAALSATCGACSAVLAEHVPGEEIWQLVWLLEGFSGAVREQAGAIHAAVGSVGGVDEGTEGPDFYQAEIARLARERAGSGEAEIVVRVVVPASALGQAVPILETTLTTGIRLRYLQCDMLVGVLFLHGALLPDMDLEAVTRALAAARALVAGLGGHLVVTDAPAALRREFDPWGAPPAARALAWSLKRELEPAGLLNPGRYSYGI